MSPDHRPYQDLVALADRILDACEDDTPCLARRIGALDPATRDELLVSDLLNAWQVFYYSFREEPDGLVRERLELEPASALSTGVVIGEVDLLVLVFSIRDGSAVITVTDGEKAIASFEGKDAWSRGMEFVEHRS